MCPRALAVLQGSPPPSSVVIRVRTHLAFGREGKGPKAWPQTLGLRGKVVGAGHSLGHPQAASGTQDGLLFCPHCPASAPGGGRKNVGV